MDLRFLASHSTAKISKLLIKTISSGGGTAAPGLLALNLDKNTLKKLAVDLKTTILVTGTNGKTTTTRLIGDFLESNEIEYIHNRHGSNLERGLVSAFLEKTDLHGKTPVKTALFEVDEAAFANVLPKLSPQVIVITNLFRDQLDRYGEVDNIRRIWEDCIKNLDETTHLILNADDPSLAYLGRSATCRVSYFGLKDPKIGEKIPPDAVDSVKCPNCRADLNYELYFISHQGDYVCKVCHFKKPEVSVWAEKIFFNSKESEFILKEEKRVSLELESKMPGLFNIYNILAAYAVISNLNYNLDKFPLVVKRFKPAFGRNEQLEIQGKKVVVSLAKNPTGFNEVIKTFFSKEDQTVLILINDLIADGRDVSWLWDVDFENISDWDVKFFVSGMRAQDMGLRLKYAGIKNYTVVEDTAQALEEALSAIPQNDTLLVIPTYTAMMELKRLFVKKGISGHFWED